MKTLSDFDRNEYSNIWVIAEILSGKIQQVTDELIGAARLLADERKSEVWTIVTGCYIAAQAETSFAYGADGVIVVEDNRLASFNDELECSIMVRLIEKYKPEVVMCGATTRGRALIPSYSSEDKLRAYCRLHRLPLTRAKWGFAPDETCFWRQHHGDHNVDFLTTGCIWHLSSGRRVMKLPLKLIRRSVQAKLSGKRSLSLMPRKQKRLLKFFIAPKWL